MYKCNQCGNEFLLPITIIIPLSEPWKHIYEDHYPTNHEEASQQPHVTRIEYYCPKCNNEVCEKRDKPFDKEYAEKRWDCILLDEPCRFNAECSSCEIGKRHKILVSTKISEEL